MTSTGTIAMAATGGAIAPTADVASNPSSPPRNRFNGQRGRGRGRGRGESRGRGRGDGFRGNRGGGGGRGRGDSSAAGQAPTDRNAQPAAPSDAEPTSPKTLPSFKTRPVVDDNASESAEGEVCFICANPIQHISLAPCNHITCHICALRLRALYKNKDCPHCRTAAPYVVFTDDATKRFEEYTDTDLTSRDDQIGIRYTSEDIVGDTVLLLRYNCPHPSCDYAGMGWPDLHRHVRGVHHKKMCDLCTRNKKVFTHEHELFTDKELENHMRHGDDKPGAVDQTGFKGHPLCGFCGSRFYDDDKLYEHCRDKHERCFLCDRRDSRHPHYYVDYNALEKHFRQDHFPCLDRECQEKKFVVFESEMDLKAHQLSEHGNSLSKDVRRDARMVDMSNFDFRPTYVPERRGGHGASRREGGGRGRDPNADPLPASSAQPMRRDEIAYQRELAMRTNIQSAGNTTARQFGGQLTAPAASSRSNGPSPRPTTPNATASSAQPPTDAMETLAITDLSSLPPAERARLQRNYALIERASNLLGNSQPKIATFRTQISAYRAGSITAGALVSTFHTLFSDSSANALGTVVRELADLFEDKTKGDALRGAWNDWRAVNEDYPSLPGLAGMHGATTASSGWAAAASQSNAPTAAQTQQQAKHSTRVLRLKNSTRRGSGGGLPGNVLVAPNTEIYAPAPSRRTGPVQAPLASSASAAAFPALPGAGVKAANAGWTGSNAFARLAGSNATPSSSAAPSGLSASMGNSNGNRGLARTVSREDSFPALPAAPKPTTSIFGYGRGAVRRDVGARDTGFSWGGSPAGAVPEQAEEEGEGLGGGGSGKGKKKGKKQVLVQWG
jgi:E3 ubiquitin-protein ligase ZNF598